MSDSYQPIYDAVRSRLSNCDIGAAVFDAVRNVNLGHYAQQATEEIRFTFEKIGDVYTRPSVVYRPKLTKDGNAWCALYGDDMMGGVSGFGDTPEAAMAAFDEAWLGQVKQ